MTAWIEKKVMKLGDQVQGLVLGKSTNNSQIGTREKSEYMLFTGNSLCSFVTITFLRFLFYLWLMSLYSKNRLTPFNFLHILFFYIIKQNGFLDSRIPPFSPKNLLEDQAIPACCKTIPNGKNNSDSYRTFHVPLLFFLTKKKVTRNPIRVLFH